MKALIVFCACVVGTVRSQYYERFYPTDPKDNSTTCLDFKTCLTSQPRWSLPVPICGEGRCEIGSDGVPREKIVYCPPPLLNEQCIWKNVNRTSFGAFPDCCPRFECKKGTTLVYPPKDDTNLLESVDYIRANAQLFYCYKLFNLPDPKPASPEVPPPPGLEVPKEPAPAEFPELVTYV